MKKILMIDDSAINIKTVERFMKDTPYELLKASSGEEGLSVLADNQIDLIFLDIEMPLLSGYDVASLIKNNEEFADIPLVMVSSRDTLADKFKGLLYGANDYLSKPYKKDAILNMIEKYIH